MPDYADTLENRVRGLIRDEAPEGRLLVAFSGGRDSTVLLDLLARACPERELLALHVDHHLHPRSAEWAAHCQAFAAERGVAFQALPVTVEADTGNSLEAAAREARYAALADQMGDGDTLLTAHHAGDQLETLLQRLVRGSGRVGLSGIRPQRPLGPGRVLRPLLTVEEAALQAHAEAHALSWVEDPSNRDERFDRNFIRHRILPLVRARWPRAEAAASRVAENMAEEAALLRELAESDLVTLRAGGELVLSRLLALSPHRRRNALRQWLREHLDYAPGGDWLMRLEGEVIRARPDASPRLVLGPCIVRRHRDRLYVTLSDTPPSDAGPFHWSSASRCMDLPGNGRLCLEPDEAGQSVCLPDIVTVRYRRPGDVFHDGRHQRRLKEWLRVAEIPEPERDCLPILLDGERIFAVGETVIDPRYILSNTGEKRTRCGRIRWFRPTQQAIRD